MMEKMPHSIRCLSCELSCQLYPDSTVRSQYCNRSFFALWPEGNHFLKTGIIEKILLGKKNHLTKGFIFVDFSFPNLRLFIDPLWVDRLASSGMRIVIISDRSLLPLANYWMLKSGKIQGVIYADDDDTVLEKKINSLFTGQLAHLKRGSVLNYTEFILLNRFMLGSSIQQIMQQDQISIKKIYVCKLRLENKIGHKIHHILSNT
jgi:DNA-binding CsgD family transcriptional regulator